MKKRTLALNDLNIKKYLKIIFMLIVIATIAYILMANVFSPKEAVAVSGLLNLEDWDSSDSYCLTVNGDWEFYWNQFVQYKDLNQVTPELYVTIPSIWEQYSINGKTLPSHGYATYRLHVKSNVPVGTNMGLYIPSLSSAYKIYINDDLVPSNGSISDHSEKEVEAHKPLYTYFTLPSSDFDILIHMSNFHFSQGGFSYSVRIGNSDSISEYASFVLIQTSFFMGILILIGIYYILIYISKRDAIYELYFGLMIFLALILIDSFAKDYLSIIFPGISMDLAHFVWYSSSVLLAFFFTAYHHELVKTRMSSMILKILLVMTICLQLFFIIASPTEYSQVLLSVGQQKIEILDLFFVICFILNSYMLFDGIGQNKKATWSRVVAFAIVIVGYLTEHLCYQLVPQYFPGMVFSYSILIYIFIHVYLHLKRLNEYYDLQLDNEFKIIQASVNPQFLFDAIDVFEKTSFHDVDKATDLMVDFSDFLRRGFGNSTTENMVPFADEIKIVETYLKIEQETISTPIIVDYELPQGERFLVPQFILQFIIESTVAQLAMKKQDIIHLRITVESHDELVRFSLKVNFAGTSHQIIKQLVESALSKWIKQNQISDITVIDRSEYETEAAWIFSAKDADRALNDSRG